MSKFQHLRILFIRFSLLLFWCINAQQQTQLLLLTRLELFWKVSCIVLVKLVGGSSALYAVDTYNDRKKDQLNSYALYSVNFLPSRT